MFLFSDYLARHSGMVENLRVYNIFYNFIMDHWILIRHFVCRMLNSVGVASGRGSVYVYDSVVVSGMFLVAKVYSFMYLRVVSICSCENLLKYIS